MDARHNADHYEDPETVALYADFRAEGLFDREARAIAEFFPESGRILDLGCGAGRTTAPLREKGYDVTAIDVSAPMARETARATDADCLTADASRLPFRENVFDAALFSSKGLDELQPPNARYTALREIRRVLRPGGRFAFSTHNVLRQLVPFPPTPGALADRVRFWLANVREGHVGTEYKHDILDKEEGVVYFGDPLSEYRQLRASGFRVLEFLGKHGLPSAYLGPEYFVVAEA